MGGACCIGWGGWEYCKGWVLLGGAKVMVVIGATICDSGWAGGYGAVGWGWVKMLEYGGPGCI